jgi:hypothetical protein
MSEVYIEELIEMKQDLLHLARRLCLHLCHMVGMCEGCSVDVIIKRWELEL